MNRAFGRSAGFVGMGGGRSHEERGAGFPENQDK